MDKILYLTVLKFYFFFLDLLTAKIAKVRKEN